jgi:hypothetical protein
MTAALRMTAMSLLGVALPVSAQEPPYALVVARASVENGPLVPLTLPIDLGEVADALGLPTFDLRDPIVAAVERPQGRLEPVLAQFDPASAGQVTGELTLLLPASESDQRVRVYFTPAAPTMPPAPQSVIEVREDGKQIVVANDHFRVTHDPAHMGGLPSRIEFVQTGKVCDTFALNDRVYAREVGGFRLGDDPEPQVQVVSRGPARVCVRVTARYLQGGKAPASAPRAEYEFTYYAGSPLVRIKAHINQAEPFNWPELHLWELNFPDQTFTRWLTGEPEAGADLAADEASHRGGVWGGLTDGANLLGIVGGPALIYDGRGGYGTYLHGPWVSWGALDQDLDVTLWIGSLPGEQAAPTLGAAAAQVSAGQYAYVSVPALEEQLTALDAAVGKLPRDAQPHWRWLSGLVRRYSTTRGALRPALRATRRMTELAASAAPPGAGERLLQEGTDRAFVLLANDNVGWAFGGVGEGLRPVSCFDFASQRELLADSSTPLWEALLQRPEGGTVTATAADCRTAEARAVRSGVELRWRLPDELGGARVRAEVKLDAFSTAWRLQADDLQPGWSLREVSFPQIAVGPIGESPDDDFVLYPRASGELKQAPLRGNIEYTGMYPDGWCTFQCMAYYDRDCGLYFGCHDPLASTKRIITRRAADGQGQLLAYRWFVPDMGVANNSFETSAPAVIRPYRGDWFDAAQIYRDWAEKSAKWWPGETKWGRPDTPQWMKETCVWACTGGKPEECVQKVKDFAAYMGVPTAFHWYSWHEIPFDVNYPHYFPTWPGVPEAVKELQAAGVRVMPYINGRLWDTALQDFKDTAIAAATKGEDGKPYIEVYGSGAKLAPMCPTQRLWQEKVQEIVLRLVTEVGVDGVYIDQIGAAAPRLCMDPTHGHPLGGGHWWTQDGYWPLLRELQAKLPPDKMITTECNAESYARYFDGYLTWHWQFPDMVPAFPAIYGGRVQLFSRAYNGDDQQAHWMRIGQQLVLGEQLGWVDPAHILPHEETADFMRRAARTRHDLLDFLSWGRMARPPKVTGGIPRVTADWAWSGKWVVTDSALQKGVWWAHDGRLLLLFANTSAEPLTAELDFDGAEYGWARDARVSLTVRGLDGPGTPETLTGHFRRPLHLDARGILALELKAENG